MPTPTNMPPRPLPPTLPPAPRPPQAPPPPPPQAQASGPAQAEPTPDRSRAGATWVTATGAFLLLAAATVFVAVQWDHIADGLKLAILGALTGGFLLAGRRLRPILPATAGVLYHLGAFLVPVLSAAVVVTRHAGWAEILLVEGLVASVSFAVLNRVERSVVLDWATVAAVVVLAAGIGATTPVPAPLALVGAAAVAEWRRRHGAAIAWAAVAGLGPIITAAGSAVAIRHDVLDALGLTGTGSGSLNRTGVQIAAGIVGVGAAAVLARNARRRQDLVLVVAAALSVLVGLVDGWIGVGLGGSADLIGIASLFVLAELGAWAVGRDPFWAGPARVAARLAEAAMTMLTCVAALIALLVARLAHESRLTGAVHLDGAVLVASGLAVAGWLFADLRRRVPDNTPPGIAVLVGGGWMPGTVAASLTALVGVAIGTRSLPLVGVAALVIAALLVLSGRPGGHTLAVLLAVPAPLLAGDRPALALAMALVGSVTIASAAVVRSRLVTDELEAEAVWLLAIGATLPVVSAGIASVTTVVRTGSPTIGALIAIAVFWVTGLVLDRAAREPSVAGLGLVPRGASILTLVAAPLFRPGGLAIVAGVLMTLCAIDAAAFRRWWMGVPTGLLAVVTAGATAIWAGATLGQTALVLLGVSVAATVADALVDRGSAARPSLWSIPLWTTQGAAIVGAALLASTDRGALATVVLVLGATVVVYGLRFRRTEVMAFGGALITVGVWLHLIDHHITATEPYLAPVALALVITGWQARRSTPISSWVAYGPAVALLGGAALAERLHGGAPIHALVAGVVGLAAVVAGGRFRLIAPLVLGTGLLVALTVNESLAVTAGVPTWGWLALGGTVLVASGIAMERAETSPIETGRRVVDAVGERFT